MNRIGELTQEVGHAVVVEEVSDMLVGKKCAVTWFINRLIGPFAIGVYLSDDCLLIAEWSATQAKLMDNFEVELYSIFLQKPGAVLPLDIEGAVFIYLDGHVVFSAGDATTGDIDLSAA